MESARRLRFSPMLLLAALALVGIDARADIFYVTVGGQSLSFSPQTIDINAGDTVTFLNFGGLHNVVADNGSFRCARGCDNDGHGGSGASSSQLWSVSINFPNAGAVGYFCETHGAPGTGMFGTINVNGVAAPPPPPEAVSIDGQCWLALFAAALIACATPWLRRARGTSRD